MILVHNKQKLIIHNDFNYILSNSYFLEKLEQSQHSEKYVNSTQLSSGQPILLRFGPVDKWLALVSITNQEQKVVNIHVSP